MQSLRNKLPIAARVLLGLIFFVFGLNGFLHFLPQPPMSGPPAAFIGALVSSGYLMTLLKGTEVLAGALLLSGRFVPLALTLLAPIIVNITAFHLWLAPGNYVVLTLIWVTELFLAWTHRAAFAPMLRARSAPASVDDRSENSLAGRGRSSLDISRTSAEAAVTP